MLRQTDGSCGSRGIDVRNTGKMVVFEVVVVADIAEVVTVVEMVELIWWCGQQWTMKLQSRCRKSCRHRLMLSGID